MSNFSRIYVCVVLLSLTFVAFLVPDTARGQASVIQLTPQQLSGDGSTVVGYDSSTLPAKSAPFGSPTVLPLAQYENGAAQAVSTDGSTIVGSVILEGRSHAAVWNGSVIDTIEVDVEGRAFSVARAVSGSGDVVMGTAGQSTLSASVWRWTSGSQSATILPLPLGAWESYGVVDLSESGSTFAGYASGEVDGNFVKRAYRGTSTGSATLIPDDLGFLDADPYAISADGSTIIGALFYEDGTVTAFKWQGTTVTELPSLGENDSRAYDVSADGSVVVGYSADLNFDEFGVVWKGSSVTKLDDVLQVPGPGWTYTSSGGAFVSDNGAIIVAAAKGPSGSSGWGAGEDPDASCAAASKRRVDCPGALVVNVTTDESDADLGDGICDVDLSADEQQCSLRAAIEEANAQQPQSQHVIEFNIGDVPTIILSSPLPEIVNPTKIDGTTQPGEMVEITRGGPFSGNGLQMGGGANIEIRHIAITAFDGFGIAVHGGNNITVVGNRLGIKPDSTPDANLLGGILVDDGATNVTIGSLTLEEDFNEIHGGVQINGEGTIGISVLQNVIDVAAEHASGIDLRALIDLDADGPTCSPWVFDVSNSFPNFNVPAPRILNLTSSGVSGVAAPDGAVIIYVVTQSGTGNGRYWPRRVEPIGTTTADNMGQFQFSGQIPPGSSVTVSTVDAMGNTSELAQLRRPVIVLPGIGGTWIRRASNNEDLWLPPIFAKDETINDAVASLGLSADGSASLVPIITNEVIETILSLTRVYGPLHSHLQEAGFPGDRFNANPAELDQWRFPNDWRISVATLADDLVSLVTRLTDDSGTDTSSPARACQVDLIGHSNGGFIASVYVRSNEQHARNRINRFVTSGTPYLGASQAYAGHTRGYVFAIDEKYPGWDVAWGRMTAMTLNVAGAYGLMPSRTFFDVADLTSASHSHGFGAGVNLQGDPAGTYDSMFDFMVRPKRDGSGNPDGLARNEVVWEDQQTVQSIVDDWRTFAGPPHIFRHVGALAASTTTGWSLAAGTNQNDLDEVRREVGDSDAHVRYRSGLEASPGWGDGTVPLLSSTIGRDSRVAKTDGDRSGVDESPWIEEFEYYNCNHVPLVEDDCAAADGSANALERLVEILDSGNRVLPASTGQAAKTDLSKLAAANREVIYVNASSSVAVVLEDASGRLTGSLSPDMPNKIVYEIPGITFIASDANVTLSVPVDSAYTVSVRSAAGADIILTRVNVTGDEIRQVLFEPTSFSETSIASFDLLANGTATTAAWEFDSDGDSTPDATIEPVAELTGDRYSSAIPVPQPLIIKATAEFGEEPVANVLTIPTTGTSGWSFSLGTPADWLTADLQSGAAPAQIQLTLSPAGLATGTHQTILPVTLRNGDFESTVQVAVEMQIVIGVGTESEYETPTSVALRQPYPSPASGHTIVEFDLPNSDDVAIELYDVLGRHIRTLLDQRMAAGRHSIQTDLAEMKSGHYFIRLTSGGRAITKSLVVAK